MAGVRFASALELTQLSYLYLSLPSLVDEGQRSLLEKLSHQQTTLRRFDVICVFHLPTDVIKLSFVYVSSSEAILHTSRGKANMIITAVAPIGRREQYVSSRITSAFCCGDTAIERLKHATVDFHPSSP